MPTWIHTAVVSKEELMAFLSRIKNTKWLSDIELIDAKMEFSEHLKETSSLVEHFKAMQSSASCHKIEDTLFSKLADDITHVTSWFFKSMPPLYLETTPLTDMRDHILSIVLARSSNGHQVLERNSIKGHVMTLIANDVGHHPALKLSHHISDLGFSSKFIRMFSSIEREISLCQVHKNEFQVEKDWKKAELVQKRKHVIQNIKNISKKLVEKYLSYLDKDFLRVSTVKHIIIAIESLHYSIQDETTYVNLISLKEQAETRLRVDICLKNFNLVSAIDNIVKLFHRYDLTVTRFLATQARSDDKSEIFSIISIFASYEKETPFSPKIKAWGKVNKSLKTLPYVDHHDEFARLMEVNKGFTLNEEFLIRSIANWTHIFLTKQNPYYFSLDRVSKVLLRNSVYLKNIILYFRSRFDPRFKENREECIKNAIEGNEKIIDEARDDIDKSVFKEGMRFIKYILKTNYFLVSRTSLSFRIDPAILDKQFYKEIPYGIFFVIGRNFRSFQVRYRDVARGGVRVVLPKTSAEYDSALAGIFDEVNGLAYAQQLKNKDIPEGGSKCVVVVAPEGSKVDAVKSTISGILDLIITNSKSEKLHHDIIDYHGKEEIIYLGPDENITDDLINWITQYASYRKYKYAYAFMSSKPKFGINHKAYGVTSEGVNVYLDNALTYLGLKGKFFRVKMTGGPDGDVAGNELKILHREYGEKAQIVAIADGSGAAYDPKGLNWKELLRLVRKSLPICNFHKVSLSQDSGAFVVEATSPENIRIRDMLYAQAEAEVFIPAGGRPYTVKEKNWSKYLLTDGRPSSLAIVEGANIFFTNEARKNLVNSGVIMIKDSSANKGGVICSSYEIIGSLTLKPEEFLDIKETFVKQVLDIIRGKADDEAKLLLREWQKRKSETNLVELSYEISNEINVGKDILYNRLESLDEKELNKDIYKYMLLQHCPPILVEKYKERIIECLPRKHKVSILSAFMASHLIYREGLNWLDTMTDEQIFNVALDYIKAERNILKIVDEIQKTNIDSKDQIMDVLRKTGAKYFASKVL